MERLSEDLVYQREKRASKRSSFGVRKDLTFGVDVINLQVTLLVITGTMGSGKTSVLAEASDLLTLQKIPHAQIDLDALGGAYLSEGVRSNDTMHENLASISQNYARLGLTHFLVARAIESRAELEECRRAVGATETIVLPPCRK